MRPDEDTSPADHGPRRGGRFALVFYERERGGSRSYLRFTNFALFLVFFLTLGAMAMILGFFLWDNSHEPQETDGNIHAPAPDAANYNGIVIQPPPPPPPLPRVVQGPNPVPGLPNPLTTPTPAVNRNRMQTPSPAPPPSSTPASSPVRTPT
jgi:hypothetical protein